ncbi:MAG: ATP-binding cassette domain-containing protein [Streptosporangiaceae bacterium]
MNTVLETCGLGRKYGRRWALRDCTLVIPAGRVVGLVGPNGAGKSTLLHLAVGLLEPTAGTIRVFGQEPGDNRALSRTGFVAQDTPVYARLSVAGHLRAGAWLNAIWDGELAERRIGPGLVPPVGEFQQFADSLPLPRRDFHDMVPRHEIGVRLVILLVIFA